MSQAKTSASKVLTPLPKWQSQYNRKAYPTWSEVNTMPSMTVPDMSMTVDEIIARSARGLKQEHMLRVPIYEGKVNDDQSAIDNYIPDVLHMDPVDQQAYKRHIDAQVSTAKKRLRSIHEMNKKLAEKLKRLKDEKSEDQDAEDTEEPDPKLKTPKPSGKGKGAKA